MEVASTFISEKKSKEISTEMMNRAHELRDMLEKNQVSFDAEFKDRIAKLADFQDVSANLDSMKDTQAAMNSIMTEIKELVDEKFGSELLESCEKFLAKQWTSTSVGCEVARFVCGGYHTRPGHSSEDANPRTDSMLKSV